MAEEHDFKANATQEQWDRTLFRVACKFVTIDLDTPARNRERREFSEFAAAVAYARNKPRCLLYAVAESERSTCLPRDIWQELLTGETKAPAVKQVCEICHRKGGKVAQFQGKWSHASCWRTERLKST